MRAFILMCAPALCLLKVVDAKQIWDALAACGITKEKIELYTGIDRRQFARQLDGDEHFRHATLAKFPPEVNREYHWAMIIELGPPKRALRSLLPMLLYRGAKKHMARMSLRQQKERKVS